MTSIRPGPVPRAAVDDLLAAVPGCVGLPLPIDRLVDFSVACEHARRFKVDVSFALTPDGRRSARFSVNDKGEPVAFRARLLAAADTLGTPATTLGAQLAVSPAGEVQTTLGVKWGSGGGLPERVSVYFEELMSAPRAEGIREAAFALVDARPPAPLPGLLPAAVCIDYVSGTPESLKDYWMLTERPGEAAPDLGAMVDRYRARFSFHPVNRTRRFLIASRIAAGGKPAGAKLIWMSEVHRQEDVSWAWAEVDRLRAGIGGPVALVLDGLRDHWRHAPGTFLYPDLLSLNLDAAGASQELIVYVSIR